jgi:hypothetical protein
VERFTAFTTGGEGTRVASSFALSSGGPDRRTRWRGIVLQRREWLRGKAFLEGARTGDARGTSGAGGTGGGGDVDCGGGS